MIPITTLKPNQVYVFGSNATGFHGAGSAGLACRGTPRNTWRHDPWFIEALKSPIGSPKRIGKWAVLGVPDGFQTGSEGVSYAIVTITHPGLKRTVPIAEICRQLVALCRYAIEHPKLEFLMTPIGCGYAGYTPDEMDQCLKEALRLAGGKPTNLIVPPDIYEAVANDQT